MYLHLGADVVINQKDIVAVLDLETTSVSRITREFLKNATDSKKVIDVKTDELPKSYVICKSGDEFTVYVSPISSATLTKRIRSNNFNII